MKILLQIIFLIICINYSFTEDPFSALGIPNLNPGQIFNTNEGINQIKNNKISNINLIPKIITVEDLQKFLKKGNFDESQGLTIVSKFLIADDFVLKKNGAVFDLTGYDGLDSSEMFYPPGSKERLSQRAKSAARLFFSNTYNDNSYDALGVEDITKFNGTWRIYKVLLSAKNSYTNHVFLKVCLPIDESLTPLVSDLNDDCIPKIQLVEESRIKNIPYLEKIKNSNIFKKAPINKDLLNERIQKENYNNMMKNYNNFMQNQNSIQTPPSMQIKNGLIDMGLNTNINQAQNNILKNKNAKPGINNNVIPNGLINGLGANNIVGASTSDIMNLTKQYNMNVNSVDHNGSSIKTLTNEKEETGKSTDESKKGNDFLGNDISFMESQSTSLQDTSANKPDGLANNTEKSNAMSKTEKNGEENKNSNDNSADKSLESAREKENELNNSFLKNKEIKNQIPNQFNNINIPQQQNSLQPYPQGMDYLMQNNPQANNYLMNQAQIMKNQMMAQRNAMNDAQKFNNLRGALPIDPKNGVQNNLVPNNNNNQNTVNPVNNSVPSPIPNPAQNINPSQPNFMALMNRMEFLEIQLKNEQMLNQAIKNEVINIRNYSDANFKKLEAAINQIAEMIKK